VGRVLFVYLVDAQAARITRVLLLVQAHKEYQNVVSGVAAKLKVVSGAAAKFKQGLSSRARSSQDAPMSKASQIRAQFEEKQRVQLCTQDCVICLGIYLSEAG